MIDMHVLVNQLIELFIIICLGYLMFKIGILNETVDKHINSLIVNVTMPCLIIDAVLSIDSSSRPDGSTVAALFAVSIGFFIIMPIIAFILVKILRITIRIKPKRQGIYMFMFIFSNVGFMGIPILRAAFGSQADVAVFFAAVLNIFFNLAVFTYGVIMIGYGDEAETTFKLKDLLSPGILSSVIGLFIYIFNFHFPASFEAVGHSITTIGDLTPPLAMILVGSTLASIPLKDVFTEWRIYVYAILKQILVPIALYPVYRLIMKDDLLFNVMFIELLMPVANIALILCTQYNLDRKFASKVIFISTIMSLVSIPVVIYMWGKIY